MVAHTFLLRVAQLHGVSQQRPLQAQLGESSLAILILIPTAFYASTPRAISGTVTGAASIDYMQLFGYNAGISNGAITQASTSVGANGFYYFLEGNGVIPDSSSLLETTSVSGLAGATTTPTNGGSLINVNAPTSNIIIDGTVPAGTVANSTVNLVYNGGIVASTITTSSDLYAFVINPSSLQTNSNYLLYLTDSGSTYFGNIETDEGGNLTRIITGLNFTNKSLYIDANGSATFTNAALHNSLGSISNNSILFSTASNASNGYDLTLGTSTQHNVNFITSSGATYQLDGSISNTLGTSNLTFNGAVNLTNSAASQASATVHTLSTGSSGAITFYSTVNDTSGKNDSLTLNAPSGVAINGALGASHAINQLIINTNSNETDSIAANITTLGSQTYGNALTLSNAPTFTSTGSAGLTFSSTINDHSSGADAFSIANNSGALVFDGSIGATTPFSSVSIGTGDSTTIGGSGTAVTTSGAITFSSPLTINGSVTLTDGSSNDFTLGKQSYL